MTQEQISQLIHKVISGEASAEERDLLNKVRAENPETAAFISELENMWQRMEPEEEGPGFDVDRGWSELSSQLGLDRAAQPEPEPHGIKLHRIHQPKTPVKLIMFGLAAVILLALLLPMYKKPPVQHYINTQPGSQVYQLSDGSTVTLGDGASLWTEFNAESEERNVRLEGRAFFEIQADGRPFAVITQHGHVEVVGTRFDVLATQGKTRVGVEEGKVAVRDNAMSNRLLFLTAGMVAESVAGHAPILLNNVDPMAAGSWRHGRFFFQDKPLKDAILDLKAHFGVAIDLENPAQGDRQITISFENQEIGPIMEELALLLSLDLEQPEKDVYRLRN